MSTYPLTSIPPEQQKPAEILALATTKYITNQLNEFDEKFGDELGVRFSNVPTTATELECREFFNQYGNVMACSIAKDHPDKWFVAYETISDAQRAWSAGTGQCKDNIVEIQSLSLPRTRQTLLATARDAFLTELKTCTFLNLPFNIQPDINLITFISQFGTYDNYSIIPYTTTSSLIYVTYSFTNSVKFACDMFRDVEASPKFPSRSNIPIIVYPGIYKPLLLQHQYDIKPPIILQRNGYLLTWKLHDVDLMFDLSKTNDYMNAYLPYSLQHHSERQHAIQQISIINPNKLYCINISGLWTYNSMPSSLQDAQDILIDIINQFKKFGQIKQHLLLTNGQLIIKYRWSDDAALALQYFNMKQFNGSKLSITLIDENEFNNKYLLK